MVTFITVVVAIIIIHPLNNYTQQIIGFTAERAFEQFFLFCFVTSPCIPIVAFEKAMLLLGVEGIRLPSASLTTTVKYFTAPLVSLNQLQLKVKLMEDLLISTSFLFTRICGGGGGGPEEGWREKQEGSQLCFYMETICEVLIQPLSLSVCAHALVCLYVIKKTPPLPMGAGLK